MVLFTLIGWAVQAFAGLDSGIFFGLIVGMLVANFVPARGACPIPPRASR